MTKPAKSYARRLTEKQAQSCENALNPRCRCRCGGSLHGAKRGGETVPPRAFFEELPDDDPHRLTSEEEREVRTRAAGEIRQLRARLKQLEHDARRLLEFGNSKPAALLEARIADVKKRIEWLRSRAHGGT